MSNTYKTLGALLVASATLASCNQPRAKKFAPTTPVTPPEYPNSTSINLTEGQSEHTYMGAFIIWDERVTEEQMTTLLKASHDYNETWIAKLKYYETVVNPAKSKVDSLVEQKQKLEDERTRAKTEIRARYADLDAIVATNASKWFETELGELSLSDEDAAHARKVFSKYCEAKIFQLAVDTEFLEARFSARPSPNALCEAVYTQMGSFNHESCAASSEGRSYFECMWTAAVNTSFVGSYFSASKKSQYLALLQSGEFKQTLVSDPTFPTKVLSGARYNNNASLNLFEVKEGRAVPGSTASFIVGKDKTLETSSPDQMLKAVEQTEVLVSSMTRRPPSARFDTDLVRLVKSTSPSFEKSKTFTSEISEFAKKKYVDGTVSSSDVAVNFPRSLPPRERPVDFTKEGLPDIFPVIDDSTPELDAQIAEIETLIGPAQIDYLTKLSAVESENGTSTEAFCARADSSGSHFCAVEAALKKRVAAVKAPGVVKTLSQMSVSTKTLEDGTMEVRLMLNVQAAYKSARGCVRLADGASIECATSSANDDAMEVSFSPISRKLSLSVTLNDVVRWGLAGKETDAFVCRTTRDENGLDSCADLEGKRLVLGLFPSALGDGRAPFFSGKTFIYDGDKEIHNGSASYLFDAETEENAKKRGL